MKGMSENDLEQLAGEMGAEPGLGTKYVYHDVLLELVRPALLG